jgi:hypothetical protein
LDCERQEVLVLAALAAAVEGVVRLLELHTALLPFETTAAADHKAAAKTAVVDKKVQLLALLRQRTLQSKTSRAV